MLSLAISRAASKVAAHVNLIPLVAVITGGLILGETLNAVQIAAAVTIVLGVVLGTLSGRRGAAQEA